MSDRKIAKNRFHKGLSAHLRITLRKVGVSLDEEMAQFALGGIQPFEGQPDEYMVEVINQVFTRRRELMTEWEKEHPDRRPYAPSFPERCIPLLNEALRECYEDNGVPVIYIEKLKIMCEAELSSSPVSIDPQLVLSEETD